MVDRQKYNYLYIAQLKQYYNLDVKIVPGVQCRAFAKSNVTTIVAQTTGKEKQIKQYEILKNIISLTRNVYIYMYMKRWCKLKRNDISVTYID